MALQSKNNLLAGVNLDLDPIRMPPNTAQFIKNLTNNFNTNASAAALAGNNENVFTPLEGNVALAISGMPSGINYCIGYYSSELTNEGYFAIYNSNSDHTVWVIRGNTGVVQKVYQSSLLPFVLDPQYFLSEGRMTLELRSIIDPVTGTETNFKFLIFTNNTKYQCVLDVEASIATNSYSTPYFTSSSAFYDQLELINLGSALPIKCIKLNNPNAYVPVTAAGIIDTVFVHVAGAGYAIGDTFTINGSSPAAGGTGQVTAIGAGGSVISFIITNGGTGYIVQTVSTTATSGGGAGLQLNIVSLLIPDSSKQNLIINEGWQFRIRTWDVWGRPSEWGIISSVFTALTGGGCISTSNGLPRCVNLCFDAGSPLVKFITVAYRRGAGNAPGGEVETIWYETETFRKYDDSTGVEWYQRPINPAFSTANSGMSFDATTNIITYSFCADKSSNPIDEAETSRTEPPIPRISGSTFSVDESVGLADNVYDFQPVSSQVIDSIQFSAALPIAGTPGVPCPAAKTNTIVVYANFYNAFGDYSPLIRLTYGKWTFGDGGASIGPSSTSSYTSNFKVGQVFGDQTHPGFIAYLAGTPYKVIGEWGDYNPTTGIFTVCPLIPSAPCTFPNIKMSRFTFVDIPAGKYLVRLASHHVTIGAGNLQETSTQVAGVCPIGQALVPWGRRLGFFSNPVKEIEVDCSAGNVNLGGANDPMFIILDLNDGVHSGAIDGYLHEQSGAGPVEMAVCYIHGSTLGAAGDAYGSFFTDHNGYFFVTSGSSYTGIDIYANLCDGGGMRILWSQTDGGHSIVHGDGTAPRNPDYWGNIGNWSNQVFLARPGGPVVTYPAGANRTIKQNVALCGQPTIGVPGIPVVMTKCQPALTDSSGDAVIIAHNRYTYLATNFAGRAAPFGSNNIPDYGTSPGNQDLLIFSQKGGCEWNECSKCTTSMADVVVTYLDCGVPASGCPAGTPARTLCLTSIGVQPNGVGILGVQSGGKYPLAFWLHDVIGRHTAPQIRSGDFGYVFVPNLNDTAPNPPFPAMALCGLQVTIPAGLRVDPVFKRITFLVGSNCLFSDFFSWAADWVQYVDNTGVTNTTNPTSIRIYLPSLNEYNKQYNFGTNIAWDFVSGKHVQDASSPRDVVQFIMNGDGTWLSPQKGAPITYSKGGSFFTIDYSPELAGLQNGCLFKVVRTKQNITGTNLPYYEQCLTLDVNNGLLPAGTYTLPYQDSYLLSRFVPVPIMAAIISTATPGTPAIVPNNASVVGNSGGAVGAVIQVTSPLPGVPNTYQIVGDQGGGIAPGATPPFPLYYTSTDNNDNEVLNYAANNNNTNGVVVFSTKDFAATYPFFFESPSPSDLWGSHLQTRGRIGIVNPYEQQYRVGTEMAISNPIAEKGIVNGMGIYLSKNREIFNKNTFGNITAVLVEMGVCMVICNNDFFLTHYNQQNIQITDNGQLLAQNSNGGIFTAPQTKVGSNYGVIPQNINTIQRHNGIVVFLDNKGHLIFSNFTSAKPVEKEGYLGYLLNKIAAINILNNDHATNGQAYFIGGIDVKNEEYNLTSFHISSGGLNSYINTQSQPNLNVNETLIFDLNSGTLKSFASYTPEYMGRIPGYYLQRQFLSFKSGVPYIHHNSYVNSVAPPLYANFYGVQCEVRITHVVNGIDGKMLPDKVKRYLWTEVYCRASIPGGTGAMPTALWYADSILSEKGQTSRLLPSRFDLKDGYATAAFLCALNTPPDPNYVPQTTTNALLDGDPLQGRYIVISFTNASGWNGFYFELSEFATYINGVEKSAD